MTMRLPYFAHDTALIESPHIGEDSRIWAFTHILPDARIGKNCNIGDHCFIESGAIIGNNVTIKNQTAIWEGVIVEDHVFIGPSVVFTNDKMPRSPRLHLVKERYATKTWLQTTLLHEGATIGARAIILCGLEIGAYAMIGAGSLVTKDVPPHALVYGHPGRLHGYVCRCGEILDFMKEHATCSHCGGMYTMKERENIDYLGQAQ